MNFKRIAGIVFLVAGIVLVIFSLYIKNQVAEGKVKVSSAQKQVDTGKSLFNVSPVSEPVGKTLTSPIQRKIDEGKRDITYYEKLANGLMIGGIVLIVLGIIFLCTSSKKRKGPS